MEAREINRLDYMLRDEIPEKPSENPIFLFDPFK